MYLIPYSTTAWIGDSPTTLAVVPVVVDGAVYVPIHFLYRAFDLGCTWGPGYSQVVIIDAFSHRRITWVTDAGWGARRHIWLHPYTYRVSWVSHVPPRQYFHGGPIPQLD